MEPALLVFLSLLGFCVAGVVWFRILRPALIDFGVIDETEDGDLILVDDDRSGRMSPSTVKLLHSDYVNTAPAGPATGITSPLPSLEVEVEVSAGSDPEAGDAFIYITEKALQSRDEETRRKATIDAYARLEAAGYLAPALAARKATALRRLLFGVSQGRALQRLNEEIEAAKDAAVIPPDLLWQAAAPTPDPAPAARPPIPVANGRIGYVEREEVA